MIFRALRALVYCEAFVVARYEYGVSSQPASGVPFSVGAELAEVLVALGDLPEEEVAVRADAGARVGAQAGHALRPGLDHLGERVLAGCALLDRQPPPGGIDPVEGVRDVLAFASAETLAGQQRAAALAAVCGGPGLTGAVRRT